MSEGLLKFYDNNHGGLAIFREKKFDNQKFQFTKYDDYVLYGSWDNWKNSYELKCKYIDCGSTKMQDWFIQWKHVNITTGKYYFKLRDKYSDEWKEPSENDKKTNLWECVDGIWNMVINVDTCGSYFSLPLSDYPDEYDGNDDETCEFCYPELKRKHKYCYNCGAYVG